MISFEDRFMNGYWSGILLASFTSSLYFYFPDSKWHFPFIMFLIIFIVSFHLDKINYFLIKKENENHNPTKKRN